MTAWAVVPAHRPALPVLSTCLAALDVPAERVVVVANGPDPIRPDEVPATVIVDPTPGRAIGRWWNLGLDAVAAHAAPAHDVLVLNADAVPGPALAATLSAALREHGHAVAYPDVYGILPPGGTWACAEPGPLPDLRRRMTGYAFLLRGELGLRADPRYLWWYGDDDLEWRARAAGGTVMVADATVAHDPAGGDLTGLEDVVAADRAAFVARWGRAPHPFGPGA